jgi:hypothetical protein
LDGQVANHFVSSNSDVGASEPVVTVCVGIVEVICDCYLTLFVLCNWKISFLMSETTNGQKENTLLLDVVIRKIYNSPSAF